MKKYASCSFFVTALGLMMGKNEQSVVQNSNLEQSKLPRRKKPSSFLQKYNCMAEQNVVLHLLLQVYMKSRLNAKGPRGLFSETMGTFLLFCTNYWRHCPHVLYLVFEQTFTTFRKRFKCTLKLNAPNVLKD